MLDCTGVSVGLFILWKAAKTVFRDGFIQIIPFSIS